MFKKVAFLLFLVVNSHAVTPSVEELTWPGGETLLTFFQDNQIPLKLYYNLEKEDQELADEIVSNTKFQILRRDDGSISQVLIPITDELQIHIYRNALDNFDLEFLPIDYEEKQYVLSITLNKTPYNQIIEETGNVKLSGAFLAAFRGSVDFKGLRKGDKLVIVYTQKTRMGRPFGTPDIKAAMMQINGKYEYSYQFNDRFYDEAAKEIDRFFLIRPVKNARVSSPFTKARFHPILKRYRAHLGIDYAAPKGTRIYAAGDGIVSFIGQKGGYGNVVTIGHGGSYMTLYAHLNGFASGLRRGSRVKQGQLVGFIGTTGMSTGPHLHFGLYRNNVAINPNSIVKIAKGEVTSKEKAEFNALKAKFSQVFASALEPSHENPPKSENFENLVLF